MRIKLLSTTVSFIFLLALCTAQALAGSPKYTFKIASLAPEGSVWTTHFQNMAREISEKSNGEIGFKIYPGGVMGDDRAMYRKMRIGQLHGGGFTMTGISEIVPDFRILGIPFEFESYEEVDRAINGLFPYFQEKFREKDLALLAMSEVGFVYTLSSEPMTTLDQLRKSKSWAPENDPLSRAFLENIGITPIPLGIPDVLPSLQTGMIDTAYNSFYGAIVLQWFTKTSYITDTPFGYAYGGLVFSKRSLDRLPREYARMVEELARKHFDLLLKDTRQSNRKALETLKDNGLKVVNAVPGTIDILHKFRDLTIKQMAGKAFSEEVFVRLNQALHPEGRADAKRPPSNKGSN